MEHPGDWTTSLTTELLFLLFTSWAPIWIYSCGVTDYVEQNDDYKKETTDIIRCGVTTCRYIWYLTHKLQGRFWLWLMIGKHPHMMLRLEIFSQGYTQVNIKNASDIIGATTWNVGANTGYDYTFNSMFALEKNSSFQSREQNLGVSFIQPGNGQSAFNMVVSTGIPTSSTSRLVFVIPGNVTLGINTISDINGVAIAKTDITIDGTPAALKTRKRKRKRRRRCRQRLRQR